MLRSSLILPLLLLAAVPLRGEDDILARLDALERDVAALRTVAPAAAEQPLADPYDKRLKALEDKFAKQAAADEKRAQAAAAKPTFQMGGQLQADFLWPGQNAANIASVGNAENTYDFRRARLTARGEAFDVVEYAIGFDFAQAGRPTFLDNYIAVRDLPILGNVRAGHYFEPFSLERLTNNRYNTFLERSLGDTFAPSRNLGIMAHDSLGEMDYGTYAAGVFRSNSDNSGDDFSDVGGWAFTSRATWLPIYDEASGGRTFMHLGAAYSYRSADNHLVAFASFPEARAGTPGLIGIPLFVNTGIISALNDQRFGGEFAFVRGPLYLQAEYMCSSVDQIGGPPLFFHGGYAFVSYFLTGEHRGYNKKLGIMDRMYPFTNFFRVRTDNGIETGWGAWEVAARISHIDLNDRNIQGGRLTDGTVTLNWHLTPYTRIKWEYIYADLNRAPVGHSAAQIGGMRFDMDF